MYDVQRSYELAEDAIQGFVKEGASRSVAEKTFEDVTRPSREYWTRPKPHGQDQFIKAEERTKSYQNWAIESLARKPLKGYELTDPDSKFEKKIQERRDQIFNNNVQKFEKIEPKKKSIPKRRNIFSKAVQSASDALHAIGEHGRAMTDAIEDLTSIKEGDNDATQIKKMVGKVITAPNYVIGKALGYVDRPLKGIIDQKKYIASGIRAVAYAQGGPMAGVVTDIVLGHKPSEKEVQKLVKASIDNKHNKEIEAKIEKIITDHENQHGAPLAPYVISMIENNIRNNYIYNHKDEIEQEFDEKMKNVDTLSVAMQVVNDAVQSQKDAEVQKNEGSYKPQSAKGQQIYYSAGGGGGGASGMYDAGFFAGFAHGKRWRSRSNFRYKKWFSYHNDHRGGGGRYAYRGKRSRFVNRYGIYGSYRKPKSSMFGYKYNDDDFNHRHIFWSVK